MPYRHGQNGEHYALSHDYKLMKKLLEHGPLFGIVDNDMFRDESAVVDPVLIRKTGDAEYRASVRGYTYFDVWPGSGGWQKFVKLCVKYNLKFVLPNQPKGGGEE